MSGSTPISSRAEILGDLWVNYRDEEEFKDFMEYNDLGLPLSYAYTSKMIELNAEGEQLVSETFDLLLAGLGYEDTGFESLDDLLADGYFFRQSDE